MSCRTLSMAFFVVALVIAAIVIRVLHGNAGHFLALIFALTLVRVSSRCGEL